MVGQVCGANILICSIWWLESMKLHVENVNSNLNLTCLTLVVTAALCTNPGAPIIFGNIKTAPANYVIFYSYVNILKFKGHKLLYLLYLSPC